MEDIKKYSEKYGESHIELKRGDLQKAKINLPIDKITPYDFKGGVISIHDMCRADQIIFVDDDKQIKELKNRYAVW